MVIFLRMIYLIVYLSIAVVFYIYMLKDAMYISESYEPYIGDNILLKTTVYKWRGKVWWDTVVFDATTGKEYTVQHFTEIQDRNLWITMHR